MNEFKDKLDEMERIIRDKNIAWDDENFRNGILLGLSLAKSVWPTRFPQGNDPTEEWNQARREYLEASIPRDVPGPGLGVSNRKPNARYFRGPYSEIYRIVLTPTTRMKIVSRWNPLTGRWTRFGDKPPAHKVEQYPEI
jgi:hypothetical protein